MVNSFRRRMGFSSLLFSDRAGRVRKTQTRKEAALMATALPDPAQIRPVEVVRTNDYSEGPVVDRQGNIYFSHGSLITRMAPDGTAVDWARAKAPNGHKIRP